tara:strand:+ start:296 stop:550 length:255 start_codon:yes stop_codon:yes gene_type:complete
MRSTKYIILYTFLSVSYSTIAAASIQDFLLNFDVSNDRISNSCINNLDVSDQANIEVWFKPSLTNWQTIWLKRNYGYVLTLSQL